ncbi:DUF1573 domain-containing protein [Aureispira anguillae]|uniref:DUF1573 domain-containing protein n=1 Tax=Aureispira anguillae TaxID=2864201 RepID=A0A915YJ16_9BACT|nr:DUF1573 domain-containing protein [Aureispira anguillae]BDS13743.1 DUF1573 domain-containing protein [Aureispira anguillae]
MRFLYEVMLIEHTSKTILQMAQISSFFWLGSLFLLIVSCNDAPPKTETTNNLTHQDTPVVPKVEQPSTDTIAIDTVVMDSMPIDTIKKVQKIERPTRKPPKIKFETISYTYDTIQQGAIVEYSFKFKNEGERPLSIKDVKGSCGCTIGSYPFLDIAPNEESVIKARFDSKGKKGPQFTTITVYSNANAKGDVLSLKGVVKE